MLWEMFFGDNFYNDILDNLLDNVLGNFLNYVDIFWRIFIVIFERLYNNCLEDFLILEFFGIAFLLLLTLALLKAVFRNR